MTKKHVGIISLIIVTITILVVGYMKSTAFMQQSAQTISTNLTQKLGLDINIDTIEVQSINTLKLSNVVIYDKSKKEIFDSKAATINFSIWSLIKNVSFTESIAKVIIDNPKLNLQKSKDGKWNYQDLISQDKSGNEDFFGKVIVNSGIAEVNLPERNLNLENINGSIKFSTIKDYDIDLSFNEATSNIVLKGTWGNNNNLKVNIDKGNIEDYLEFIPQNSDFKIMSGELCNLNITINKKGEDFYFAGMGEFNKVSASFKQYNVENITGYFIVEDNKMRVYSNAEFNNQKFGIAGEVDFQNEVKLNLKIKANSFDIAKALPKDNIKGKADFDIFVFGAAENPEISGDLEIKNVLIKEQQINKIKAEFIYKNDIVTINNGVAIIGLGEVNIKGSYNIVDGVFKGNAEGKNISVEKIFPQINGTANFNIIAKGKNIDDALVYGTVNIKDGNYKNIAFKEVGTRFYKKGSDYIIDYANVALPQGSAGLQGRITNEKLDLKLYANKLPLDLIKAYNEQIVISGNADIFANIGGTVNNPKIDVQIDAENGEIYYQPFTEFNGTIRVADNKIIFDKFVMNNGSAKHEVVGFITLESNPYLSLNIKTNKARAENLIKAIFPGKPLTGNVDNQINLQGYLDSIAASGEVILTEGSYDKLLLTKVKSSYKLKDNTIYVENCEINAPNLQVNLHGAIDKNEQLDFIISANNIDMARLNLDLPYPVSGISKFNGNLTGSLDKPHFIGKLEASGLIFNEQEIKNVQGDFEFINNIVKVKNFSFEQGKGLYDFTANIDLNNHKINGEVEVKNARLNPLLAMFNLKQDWLDGDLNGQIAIGGYTNNPEVWLKGNVRKGNIKNYSLDTIDVDISFANKIVSINEFTATQGQGILLSKGTIALGGDLNVEIAGNNIDAGLIEVFTKTNMGVKGNLNFATQIYGTENSPKANISVEIKNGGIGHTLFDSLYGMFILDNDLLTVDQMMLTKGEYKASAYGIIPLEAMTQNDSLPIAQQMDLKLKLDHADLSILPFLSEEVSWATGATKGNINITGSVNNLLVNGGVKIDNGVIKLKSLEEPINNVKLDLKFNGDKINLETFRGEMGSGYFNLKGFAKIKGFSLEDYNLDLELANPILTSKYFQGPLQGNLKLLQEKNAPKIIGKLVLENCTIDIPMLDEVKGKMPLIRFDIGIDVGKKVRLYNSYLYDIWINGNVNVGGSTRWPKVTGTVNAIRGNVNYLRTVFRIREASAIFNQLGTFMPSLHLDATTKIDRTNISLKINGPVGTNNFSLSSSPEMSQQEILSLLTLRSRYFNKVNTGSEGGQSNNELATLVGLGFQVGVLNGVENEIRKGLGLDEFQLVRDTISEKSDVNSNKVNQEIYNLEFGKYVSDKVLVKYIMGVDYEHYAIGVRYDFNNSFSLTADIDQDSKTKVGLEKRFKF